MQPHERPPTCQWDPATDQFTSAVEHLAACGLPATVRLTQPADPDDPTMVNTAYVCLEHTLPAMLEAAPNTEAHLITYDRSN